MSKHLAAHIVVNTRCIDEMRAALFDVYDAHSFEIENSGSFAGEAAYARLSSSILSFSAHQSPARIEFRDDDYLRLQVCTYGSGRTSFAGQSAALSPTAIVASPAEARMEFGATMDQFALRMDRAALEQDLAALLGTRPKDRLTFDVSAASHTGPALRLRNNILHAVSTIDTADAALPGPIVADMDRSLRLSALYGMPNNYTAMLEAPVRHAAPWQVLRIEQWIDAHWRQNVNIEDLADISGISGRSIFATFKKARGYTPMAYLKKVRLEAARRLLLRASPGDSVTAIGLACQFANLGHFAQDYQRQFGERPSETLANARRLVAA